MKFSKGDRKAFERMVDRYEKPIFNVAFRMVNDYEDAMDITQTAFVKAYENLDRYDPSHKFFSWIYKIAVNESLNLIKKRKRSANLNRDFALGQTTPDEYFAQSETAELLQDGLMELKFDYRVVVILKHFMSFSYKEIGEILGISEKTTKSRLYTGRQQLRDILVKQGYER
ncbi:MAG: sigma-70 family RNA polymerase sigma factor [Candidatus Eiseniibacteriota bacterium]|nr:MAG: sigma-70 family RNA polymerase sigma factor [Candidatus Eisenbacteria bacterium]